MTILCALPCENSSLQRTRRENTRSDVFGLESQGGEIGWEYQDLQAFGVQIDELISGNVSKRYLDAKTKIYFSP